MGAMPLSSHACRIRIQGELVTQVQTKAREDLQSCVANALLNARTVSSSVPTAAGSRKPSATQPIRHDFVWSEEERREGHKEVPWEPLGGALAGSPGGAYP